LNASSEIDHASFEDFERYLNRDDSRMLLNFPLLEDRQIRG